MLVEDVFESFYNERYRLQREFICTPEKEIVLEQDINCRKNVHLFDRTYKCISCHNLAKIARQLPCFTIETGEKKGQKYTLEKNYIIPFFATCGNNIIYDNFRGAYLISILLHVLEIPTLSYIVSSYRCQGNSVLIEELPPLREFNLSLCKQLIFTLHLLHKYRFVFDDLDFYVSPQPINIEYEGVKISSPCTLKIRGWENCSLSFSKHRLISGTRLRKTIICEGKCEKSQEKEFRITPLIHDFKHLGITDLNIYTCFLKLRPHMTCEVIELWKKLWRSEEYDMVEELIDKKEFSLELFSLKRGVLGELFQEIR